MGKWREAAMLVPEGNGSSQGSERGQRLDLGKTILYTLLLIIKGLCKQATMILTTNPVLRGHFQTI